MGVYSELALRRIHAGPAEPYRRLTIGGEEYLSSLGNQNARLRSATADFDPKNGGSGLTLDVNESLEGLQDEEVRLEVGYGGKGIPYFIGKLQEPGDMGQGKATAYGAFKLMSDQSFGERTSYQGVSMRFFLKDLIDRAGYPSGIVDVKGGDDYTIEKAVFTDETRFAEGAKSVLDPAKFVIFSRPGGRLTAMPEPKPGATGKVKAAYSEANYKTFTTRDTREGFYARVIVFRRDSAGNDLVRGEAPVPQRGKVKAPENRIYWVPEFPGNSAAAKQQAYETANMVAAGVLEGDLQGIWINPELEPWDTISVERTERRPKRDAQGNPQRRGKWRVTYAFTIRLGLSLDVGPLRHHMALRGGAVEVSKAKLPDPIRLNLRPLSAGVIVATRIPGLKPDTTLKPDEGGLKPDTTLKPDVALKPDEWGLKPEDLHF